MVTPTLASPTQAQIDRLRVTLQEFDEDENAVLEAQERRQVAAATLADREADYLLGGYPEPLREDGKVLTAPQREAWVRQETQPERIQLEETERMLRGAQSSLRVTHERLRVERLILQALLPGGAL